VAASAWLRRWWGLLAYRRDEQTVSFLALANGLVRITRRRGHADVRWLPATRGQLRRLVRRLHEHLADGDPRADAAAASVAGELADALGLDEMIAGIPPHVRRLRIFPDDQLHTVPFAALPVGAGQVIDRFVVTIGVRRVPPLAQGITAPTRVTLAAADVEATGPPLVHAAGDVTWLAEWWRARGVTADDVTGGRCQAPMLLDALGASDVMHFSGHGRFDPDSPEGCGIVAQAASGAPEIVSLARLAAVDCRRLRLATLFACWGADSFLFPGQWTVSIPATLCRAGAGCVVAPLWEIDDAMAGEMLRNIYSRLDHMPVDEAVREAQLAARTDSGGRMRSPFLWAALQVYGNGSHVRIGGEGRWRH
jgi:CHAT domain-containing protein